MIGLSAAVADAVLAAVVAAVVIVVACPAIAAPAAAPDCDGLRGQLQTLHVAAARGPLAPGVLPALILQLPPVPRARLADELGRQVGAGVDPLAAQKRVLGTLATAIDLFCPQAAPPAASTSRLAATFTAENAAALVAGDERFTGVRLDRDAFGRLRDRVLAWLEALLESESMLTASEGVRTIFLTIFLPLCAFLAFRVWRKERSVLQGGSAPHATVEHRRRRAFAEWRSLASSSSDHRLAALYWRQALLARVGEKSAAGARAVRPSRTTPEILADLQPLGADGLARVARALRYFDDVYYGGHVDADTLTTLSALVDDAARILDRREPA